MENPLIKKINAFSIVMIFFVALQCIFIAVNAFAMNDGVNFAMYVVNYLVGFTAIASLVYRGLSRHYLAISFLGCYMLFLMGQKPFEPRYDEFLTFVRLRLDTSQYFLFSCILFIGLAVTYYTYLHFSLNERPKRVKLKNKGVKLQPLIPVMIIILCLTLPCALYMQAKIVLVRSALPYTSGYLINVDVPALIKVGYYVYTVAVLLFFALKPPKGPLYFFLGSFIVVEGGLQLFQGRRALFASALLFTIWYLMRYKNVKKINWQLVVKILAVLLALVLLFYVVEQLRGGSGVNLSLEFIRKFLTSTGGSDSVIANTIARQDEFPAAGMAYVVDPLINNPLFNLLLGKTSSAQGNVYLEQHNSFSHWISYLTEPTLYLAGHGMGSCYLAEAYLGLGLVGVILASVGVGYLLHWLRRVEFNDNLFRTGLIFYIVRHLFTLPRDGLLSWASGLIYLLFTYALVYSFYWRYCKNGGGLSRKGTRAGNEVKL